MSGWYCWTDAAPSTISRGVRSGSTIKVPPETKTSPMGGPVMTHSPRGASADARPDAVIQNIPQSKANSPALTKRREVRWVISSLSSFTHNAR